MQVKLGRFHDTWKRIKSTPSFHNAVTYLIFVAVSALFWFILTLNDNAQDGFRVKIAIVNCPDSVTFIDDIPTMLNVTVRDKGTNLWRDHYRNPTLNINFKDYSHKGQLLFGGADMQTSLKQIFGATSQIVSTSIDSISLTYTTRKGKRVPVIVRGRFTAVSGSTIEGNIKVKPSNVLVFGERSVTDTIHKVYTELIEKDNIGETTDINAKIARISDVRILPSTVQIEIPVEPLVKKTTMVTISTINVPHGMSLLLFPSKVPVEYYVAMSRLNDNDDENIELLADFEDISRNSTRLNVVLGSYPDRLKNVALKNDSVEYTIIKN